jgi:hypothetical protein
MMVLFPVWCYGRGRVKLPLEITLAHVIMNLTLLGLTREKGYQD